MPRRVEDFRGLTRVSRLRILHSVHRQPGRRLAEIASEVNLHLNTTREHLAVLEAEGLVHSLRLVTGVRGRPPVVFHPVTDAHENDAAHGRATAAAARGNLLRRLEPELDRSAELGVEAMAQLDALYEHLEDIGLEPQPDDSQLRINVAPCRYAFAITTERALVCSVHIQLLKHQLQQVPGPVRLRSVKPFVTPTRCEIALEVRDGPSLAEREAQGAAATS
ncbi:ArsR family transcriptional regulator [Leucobacter aridicollis]|uniref:ArsR family transcriptional regulator n=1 Tax=Leucobacter aridicollis TaxID=283878 RepID=UPI000E65770B|nr:ArsR family transcriptional regulator [Leucobacter aridicollis]UTX52637.1 ArsR family transcriptional regulator [Leucobacter aridicollis]